MRFGEVAVLIHVFHQNQPSNRCAKLSSISTIPHKQCTFKMRFGEKAVLIHLQYCAKLMQVVFNKIPGFSWLFKAISFEKYFSDFSPQFCDAYCFNLRNFLNDNLLCPEIHCKFANDNSLFLKMRCKFSSSNSLFQKICCKFLSINSLRLSLVIPLEKFDRLHVGEYFLCKASITTA